MVYKNRVEAGKLLAKKLKGVKEPLVLAIPRGGVEVAFEVAKKLKCPLDITVARKLGAPTNPELAIGAVTAEGDIYLDEDLIGRSKIHHDYIVDVREKEMKEAQRREKTYRSSKEKSLKGKTVILVDDGLATGATMEVVVRSVKRKGAKKVIVAIPVAPQETVEKFKKIVDEVVVLSIPESFYAIGQFYSDFPQVSDEDVVDILSKINRGASGTEKEDKVAKN